VTDAGSVTVWIEAYVRAWNSNNPAEIGALFTDDAELSNLVRTERGRDGARQFWEAYRPAFLAARLCHDLQLSEQDGHPRLLGDPMEIALVEMAQQALPELPPYRRLDEIPFDADRMRLSTIHAMPEGATLYCKGALQSVLPLCNSILTNGQICVLQSDLRERIVGAQETMAEQGLRVLALAYRALPPDNTPEHLEQDLVFAGLVGLEDPPRPEVADAIGRCREAGVKVIMITGDHPRTAAAVARNIGLVQSKHPSIITGEQLSHLSTAQLILALDAPEIIFARVAADQKTRVVEALKYKKHVVAVTGDGVNDAPALKSAHIGIAMGIAGTDVAKEAADMVLLEDMATFKVRKVIFGGDEVVDQGKLLFDNQRPSYPAFMTDTVRLAKTYQPDDFRVPTKHKNGPVKVRVIGVSETNLVTSELIETLEVADGVILPDPQKDVAMTAMIDRLGKGSGMSVAFIKPVCAGDEVVVKVGDRPVQRPPETPHDNRLVLQADVYNQLGELVAAGWASVPN